LAVPSKEGHLKNGCFAKDDDDDDDDDNNDEN
jgi:hypothetical protein